MQHGEVMSDLFDSSVNALTQYPESPHPSGKGCIISVPHGELIYIPQFIESKIADRTLEVFFANPQYDWRTTDWGSVGDISHVIWENIKWQQDTIKMYGKEHKLPRVSAWYGDQDKSYKYSGILLHPHEWTKPLLWFKEQLRQFSGVGFNSVLMNWYRDGNDYISWHADAEPELGKNPTVNLVDSC
jgi:alkylated DNA repair dioxygenase AlkB